MTDSLVLYEVDGSVGIITMNRPDKLNAINPDLRIALAETFKRADEDHATSVVLLRANGRSFCVGYDIGRKDPARDAWKYDSIKWHQYLSDSVKFELAPWDMRKPVVAQVQGHALGGGCELAMMCDILIAADTARFGQPEIKLGVMPGAGGTQRLTRVVGKAKAMEMCLTGRMMNAEEAERSGLVTRVVPAAELLAEALKTADIIAGLSLPIVMMAKESVNRAYETTLAEGIRFERRLFHAMFATRDQKEGMAAFVEKRAPRFTNE
ncbi:MAG: enoyl-CoA hydratase-related protein [Microvirga sp.]